MRLRSVATTIADLFRINGLFLSNPAARNSLRRASDVPKVARGAAALERGAAPDAALAYEGLSDSSIVIAGVTVSGATTPHLNVAIGELREGTLFAGVHTALGVAAKLAEQLSLPLRVVMLDWTSPGNSASRARELIESQLGLNGVAVLTREAVRSVEYSPDDVWVATHSKTAHALQIACLAGVLETSRVVYLIQDYEPGFSPWSTESVTAAATYHAGFVPLVNSLPLWQHLTRVEAISIDRRLVFAPSFDEERLRRTADARDAASPLRVLFYARPSKPRNLFRLGLASLRVASRLLRAEGIDAEFVSVGEGHRAIELSPGTVMTSLGRLGWGEYFDYLATVDIVLSLQQSPHPSHPPFDAAISGALAVTNDFEGTRTAAHPRISVAAARPDALAAAIVSAARARYTNRSPGYLPIKAGVLGEPLEAALEAVVALLNRG